MPKASDQKKAELEAANARLKHAVRETKPIQNYLEFVRRENAKYPRRLQNTASLPSITSSSDKNLPTNSRYKTPLNNNAKALS